MKLTFISFYFINPGLRFLSSYLKNYGCHVDLIFLPPDKMYNINEAYPEAVLDDLKRLCKDSDVIGLSVYTNDFHRASRLTSYLKKNTDAIIFWGGIHPTISPESSPSEVDYIYVGEGERGMLDIVRRLERNASIKDCDNLCYRDGDGFHRNRLSLLLRDVEMDHFQDFDLNGHYIRNGNAIVGVTEQIVRDNFDRDFEGGAHGYLTIFSRGCVHDCAYCCNNVINRLYKSDKPIYRTKTVKGMIEELKFILDKFSFIGFVNINDDNFMTNSVQRLSEFAELYKKEVGIPFAVFGSPVTTTEEKIKVLKAAGLREVHIGVQSGSERLNKDIYKRKMSNESVKNIATLVHKYNIRGRYDFIFDNPYETAQDLLDTARLILQLPKPYIFQSFSLTYFPGTELYDKAKKDGKIIDEKSQIFEKVSNRFYEDNVTYLKLICVLLPRIPYLLGKILISKPLVYILHRNIFNGLYRASYRVLYSAKERFNISVKSFYKKQVI